jgi:beta-lactamase class A
MPCPAVVTFLSRRDLLVTAAGLLLAPALPRAQSDHTARALQALEARSGGRLGVCVLDTATKRVTGHRLDERFAMCSTFKLPLAAVILREADQGRLTLTDVVTYSERDLLSYAPVTSEHLKKGGTTIAIGALAEAAQVTSDNTAANLLLLRIEGPSGFTARLREVGDQQTRLDRTEPMLNLVVAGDERDTTTPRAMAHTVAAFLTGDLLTRASRDLLIDWMVKTRTGDKRIRAGLPKDWRVGDKTGTGTADAMTDKINDVAIAFPPGRGALVITAYYDSDKRSKDIRDEDQAVLAEVGRLASAW